MTQTAGRALGSRYLLLEAIGQGASGAVWRAEDRQTGSPVAAKLLWPQHTSDPEVLTRFINERSVLLGLDHPHIVRVHDFVVEGQDLAIVMDLIKGPSLAAVVAEHGPLPAAVAVPLVVAVLDALDSAHGHGVVHRDVKPDNILLARPGAPRAEDVRLADFGIAGIVAEEGAPATELIGTPHYMPPELVSYGKFGPASDVYAAGVVLYHLLAGRSPFAGPGAAMTVAMRQVNSAPPRLPLDDALWRVIDLMLAKDPAQRASASSAAGMLRRLPADALAGPALPTQPVPQEWEPATTSLPAKAEVERALGGAATRAEPVDHDPAAEETSLRSTAPLGRPAPAPVAETAPDDADATMMKAAAGPLAVAVPAEPEPMSARRKILIGAGATVLLGAAAAVLWTTGVFESDDTEQAVEITTAPSHLSGTSLPTGLRMDLDAAYDSAEQVTDLTVTLSTAPQAPLRGDVLVVLPGIEGGTCAEAQEDEAISRVRASSDGIDLDCGYRLSAVELAAGASVAVHVPVELDLVAEDGTVPDDFRDWLTAVQQATESGLSTVTGTDFPLQRVAGIRAEATDVTLDGSTAVPYRVVATWSSGAEGSETELFTQDTIDGMEVELLDQLSGGAGLDGVTVSTCNAAQVIGIRVLADQPETSCSVRVVVGALDSGEGRFSIRMR